MKYSATTRILSVLEELVDASRTQGAGTPVASVLASVLGTEPSAHAHLHGAYSRIVNLCSDAIAEVEQCFDDVALPTEVREQTRIAASAPLRQAFDVLVSNSVLSQVGPFASILIGEIRILAIATRRQVGREEIAVDHVAHLRQSIDELRSAISESTLPDALKAYLLSILRDMECALDEYQVFGFDEVANQFGKLFMSIASARELVDSTENISIWEKLNRVAALISIVQLGFTYGPPLLQSAAQLLNP